MRNFWDSAPCGANFSTANEPREFIAETARVRYQREPHIPAVARFEDFADRSVLEIGCGIGADGASFASAGARYVGVDLSAESAALAKKRLALLNLSGEVVVTNAQQLPFAGESFDHIYSFGVMHHSPSIEAIVDEMHRVLRPGGTFCVMLYNKSSINYSIEIMGIRRIVRWLLWPSFSPLLLARMTGIPRVTLEGHRASLGRKMTRAQWISMNTDGPDCPLANVYSRTDVLRLFKGFDQVSTEVYYFNRAHWPGVGRILPAEFLGRRWGWHRIVRGVKA